MPENQQYEKLPSFTESLLPCLLTNCGVRDELRGQTDVYCVHSAFAESTQWPNDSEWRPLSNPPFDLFNPGGESGAGDAGGDKAQGREDGRCSGDSESVLTEASPGPITTGTPNREGGTSIDPLKAYDPLLAQQIVEELGLTKSARPEGFCLTQAQSGTYAGGQMESSGKRNAWGRLSYADLIGRAIESSPEKRLTLAQIYEWIIRYVPYFHDKGDKKSSVGWKNSVRHNLSLHDQFVRIRENDSSKASWWTLNTRYSRPGVCEPVRPQPAIRAEGAAPAHTGGCKRKKKILSTLAALEGQLHHMAALPKKRKQGGRQGRSLSDDVNAIQGDCLRHERQTASVDGVVLQQLASQMLPYDDPYGHCAVNSCSDYLCPPGSQYMPDHRHPVSQPIDDMRLMVEPRPSADDMRIYLRSPAPPTGKNSGESSDQLENATLLLSAACSLMNGNAQGQDVIDQTLGGHATSDEVLFLLQLTNGQLCQVRPSDQMVMMSGPDFHCHDQFGPNQMSNSDSDKSYGTYPSPMYQQSLSESYVREMILGLNGESNPGEGLPPTGLMDGRSDFPLGLINEQDSFQLGNDYLANTTEQDIGSTHEYIRYHNQQH